MPSDSNALDKSVETEKKELLDDSVEETSAEKLQDLEAKDKVERIEQLGVDLADSETEEDVVKAVAKFDAKGEEPSKEEIQNELNALKDALITEEKEVEEKKEETSKVHKLHEKLGMAGSRNAFPIEKDRDPNARLGQRPGMFIGIPNRHNRKHLKKNKPQEKLGKGAFKIDNDRPVNN